MRIGTLAVMGLAGLVGTTGLALAQSDVRGEQYGGPGARRPRRTSRASAAAPAAGRGDEGARTGTFRMRVSPARTRSRRTRSRAAPATAGGGRIAVAPARSSARWTLMTTVRSPRRRSTTPPPSWPHWTTTATASSIRVRSLIVPARTAGASLREAALISNHAAGIAVGGVGTTAVGFEDLSQHLYLAAGE